ncbi:biotin carboxyl carrier protein [Tistlia consotensis]|uniref:Biotin carboxyl carrier protein of acetyl-CoA carboxylase n=1 Tax=Tistlia consotensis USBA 355 TaxID=560819 RepID=A0A1Y6CI85_9PROT|nr:acetyl-CoA carboxylase biotin carboxyl carrier protein [Tistlia consotensis]SMF67227.1 biotin carboxyl carrier protein [Tistlia consotensis USBA 355]SNS00239.1 biotin carboxyl carrier protein [Tistlia consotensis]
MTKFPIDEEALRTLAGLLEETGLSEIEVAEGERRLRVARHAAPVVQAALPPAQALPVQPAAALPAAGAPAPAAGPAEGTVSSPMVGTAYLAPEPGAATFVSVGGRVEKGQTLMIIEAMKVMNALPAPHAGTVKEILIQDGQPVEFGEPLMVIG